MSSGRCIRRRIPLDERHGKPRDLFTIWFSSNIMPLTFVTGALAPAVFGLSFWWSLIAIVLAIRQRTRQPTSIRAATAG
jgi:purine-cytosine permease-like protein